MELLRSSSREILLQSNGYQFNYQNHQGLFYTFVCHSNCETCEGPLPSQFLTCPIALLSFNGLCACPTATIISNTTNFRCQPHECTGVDVSGVSTACEQTLYRVKVPDSIIFVRVSHAPNKIPATSAFSVHSPSILQLANCPEATWPPDLLCHPVSSAISWFLQVCYALPGYEQGRRKLVVNGNSLFSNNEFCCTATDALATHFLPY